MTYAVVFRKAALRKLAALPASERQRLFDAVSRLAEDPATGTPLKGKLAGLYRLRVGDRRVIYEITPDAEAGPTVVVRAIGSRGDIYR